MQTPGGQTVTLKDGPGSIELQDSNGNDIRLDPSGIAITTTGTLSIQASDVEMTAPSVNVTTPLAVFSGVHQADTVIASSVVGASYTHGAGNIW